MAPAIETDDSTTDQPSVVCGLLSIFGGLLSIFGLLVMIDVLIGIPTVLFGILQLLFLILNEFVNLFFFVIGFVAWPFFY